VSVDIAKLSANLSPQQQREAKAEYRRQAKSPTTAFLLCFFLGIFGAHRFYLGDVRQGLLRLIISPLVLPGLVLEIIDLTRIDGEVESRNLKAAEAIIARIMLAQPKPALDAEAIAGLDASVQAQRSHASAEAAAAAFPAVTTAAESVTDAGVAGSAQMTESTPSGAAVGGEAAPPVWPIAPMLSDAAFSNIVPAAAEAPASGLSPIQPGEWASAASQQGGSAYQPVVPPAAAVPAWDEALGFVAASAQPEASAAPDASAEGPEVGAATEQSVESDVFETGETVPAAGDLAQPETTVAQRAPSWTDPTDRTAVFVDPGSMADIGEPHSSSMRIELPAAPTPHEDHAAESLAALSVGGADPMMSATAPTAPDASSEPAELEPTSTLVFIPDEALTPDAPQGSTGGEGETGTLTAASEGLGAATPASDAAVEAQPAAPAMPLEDAPGDGSHFTEEVHEAQAETTHRTVKRVRVIRRLLVNGQVVQEATAEEIVDSDADTAIAAARLREALGQADTATLAALSEGQLASGSETGGESPSPLPGANDSE
jgi:hypothetical protein